MSRRSGKTFRAVCKALHDASEGKQVAILSENSLMAKETLKRARAMALIYLSQNDVDVSERELRIIIRGGGSILFLSQSEYTFMGWNRNNVIIDYDASTRD